MVKKFTIFLTVFILAFTVYTLHPTAANPPENLQGQNTMSVLWFQKSAEARSLYYQGYNIGKMRLDDLLSKRTNHSGLKPAVVLDIDETILDNSPMHAWNVVTHRAYPMGWTEWINRSQGNPLPGAIDFLKYADSKGVAIFYITNRKEVTKARTMQNLQDVGAPQVDSAHVLMLQPNERGKETRRMLVAKTHDILLLFGDNLGDFSGFDGLSVAERMRAVDQRKEEFGRKLIVFPNPMYGDWEGAIYKYDYRKTKAEKAKMRKENLEPLR